MAVHTIRLRGAWSATTTGGRARHARKFGRPRTLDAGERVWLVCNGVPGPTSVFVNGESVGMIEEGGGPFAADVTDRLEMRNEVVFDTAATDPLGEVVLEIRDPDAAQG